MTITTITTTSTTTNENDHGAFHDDHPDDDLPADDPDPDVDPDLVGLLRHADAAELRGFLPLAGRLLEAAGDDPDGLPPGERLVQALYVLVAASCDVAGRDDPLAWAGLGFLVKPEDMRIVVRFWRRAAALGEEEIERRVQAVRARAARERKKHEGDRRDEERPRRGTRP